MPCWCQSGQSPCSSYRNSRNIMILENWTVIFHILDSNQIPNSNFLIPIPLDFDILNRAAASAIAGASLKFLTNLLFHRLLQWHLGEVGLKILKTTVTVDVPIELGSTPGRSKFLHGFDLESFTDMFVLLKMIFLMIILSIRPAVTCTNNSNDSRIVLLFFRFLSQFWLFISVRPDCWHVLTRHGVSRWMILPEHV